MNIPQSFLVSRRCRPGGLVWRSCAGAGDVCLVHAGQPHAGLRTCDVFVPGLALGHAFGRVGCFAAGCCYGRETHVPWAVTFRNPLANEIVGTPLNVPLHPTQLYEMLLELCNCLFLVWLIRRKKFEGEIIGAYMMIYGVGRYFIEFFRDDPGRGTFLGFMSGTQAISIGLVIFGGILWMRRVQLSPPVAAKAVR